MQQAKNKARRLILRNLVLGGSATAATKLMPDSWVKPVVSAVISPAHAQMSEEEQPAMPTGIFQTDGDIMAVRPLQTPAQDFADKTGKNDNYKSVLDYFIKPAHAGEQVVVVEDDPVTCDNVSASFQLTFNIETNPGNVDICFDGGISLSSTIDGTDIADFSFKSTDFTNVVASDEMITGDVMFPLFVVADVDDNSICTRSFSAPLVEGVFSCTDGR